MPVNLLGSQGPPPLDLSLLQALSQQRPGRGGRGAGGAGRLQALLAARNAKKGLKSREKISGNQIAAQQGIADANRQASGQAARERARSQIISAGIGQELGPQDIMQNLSLLGGGSGNSPFSGSVNFGTGGGNVNINADLGDLFKSLFGKKDTSRHY